MEIEIESVLKKSFTLWNRDGQTWKYVLAIYAVSIFFLILFGIVMLLLFGPVVLTALTDKEKLSDPSFLAVLAPTIISNIFVLIVVLVPLILIDIIALAFLYTLIQVRALQLNGFSTAKFSLEKFAKLIVLAIFVLIAAFLSIYNKTFLILSVIYIGLILFSMLLLSVAPPIGALFLLLVLLLGVPYLLLVFYNSFRLGVSAPIFLHKEISITDAAKQSWKITKGNVLMIFLVSLVIGIVVGVASAVLNFAAELFGSGLDLALGVTFFAIVFSLVVAVIIDPIVRIPLIYTFPTIYAELGKPSAKMKGDAKQGKNNDGLQRPSKKSFAFEFEK